MTIIEKVIELKGSEFTTTASKTFANALTVKYTKLTAKEIVVFVILFEFREEWT